MAAAPSRSRPGATKKPGRRARVSGNIRLRAALCLALSLVDTARARADEPHSCAEHAPMVASWLTATHGVRAAERAIDELEADPVLAQHSSCTDAALYARRCSDSTYDREQALEQARAR